MNAFCVCFNTAKVCHGPIHRPNLSRKIVFLMKRSVTVMTAFHSQSPFLSKLYILAKCRNEFVIVKLYSINRRKVSVIFLVIF